MHFNSRKSFNSFQQASLDADMMDDTPVMSEERILAAFRKWRDTENTRFEALGASHPSTKSAARMLRYWGHQVDMISA